MASTFFERIDHLADSVGHGHLVGKVEVDQVYSHYQHEHPEFKHPEGGKAYFLRDPLFEGSDKRMQGIAERAITSNGSEIKGAMGEAMEHLSSDVYDEAPHEFGDLRASGHPTVTDDGAVIYDRAPNVPRLSEGELRAKGRVRSLFPFDRQRRA